MTEALLALLIWLSQHASIPVTDNTIAPKLAIRPASELVGTLVGSRRLAAMSNSQFNHLAQQIQAVYDPARRAIYIRPDLDINSVWGKSVLLHELVHHLQFSAGLDKTVDCPRALERQAYAIQRDYLLFHDHPVAFHASTVRARSRC